MTEEKNSIASPTSPAPEHSVSAPAYESKLTHLRMITSLIARNRITSMFCTGDAGCGKSHCILSELANCGLTPEKDFVVARGISSPLGMYKLLFENRFGLLVFDDFDSSLKNAANVIKAVTSEERERTVHYASTRLPPNTPASFTFSGRVIFISNVDVIGSNDPHLTAIVSRTHFVSVFLTLVEKLHYIEHKIVPQGFGETTLADRKFVFHEFRRAALTSEQRVCFRRFRQAMELFTSSGGSEIFRFHLTQMLPQSPALALMRDVHDNTFSVDEACREWCARTGKSRSAFFYAKRRFGEWF